MSREHILVVLGLVCMVAPFSGLPLSWLSVLYPLVGASIVFIGVTLVRRKKVSVAVPTHEASSSFKS